MCWLNSSFTNPLWFQLLEYASPVWSPHTKKDTQKLELMQRHVTKAILAYRDMNYETQLHVLELVCLEERRRIKDLVTCYKYINGFTDVDVHYFTPSLCLRDRSSHNQKLQIQFCRTNCFKFNRVVLAFLILLFLLRILSCLENICLCIIQSRSLVSQCCCACFFVIYSLFFLFFFFFLSGMSLHRSVTFCSYSFHHLMNKIFQIQIIGRLS